MSISRIKPGNWSVNEKLTSAQMNGVDTNVTNALDKRAGQTDSLSSTVTVGGQLNFGFGSLLSLGTGSTIRWQSTSDVTFGHLLATTTNAVNTTFAGQSSALSGSSGGNLTIQAGNNGLTGGELILAAGSGGTGVNGTFRIRSGPSTIIIGNSNFTNFANKCNFASNVELTDVFVDAIANTYNIFLTSGNNFILKPLDADSNIVLGNNLFSTKGGAIYTIQVSQNLGAHNISFGPEFVFGTISNVADPIAGHRTIWVFKAARGITDTGGPGSAGPVKLFCLARNNFPT